MFDLEEVRDKAKLKLEKLLKKIRAGPKISEEHISAEGNGALSCCYGVLRSVRGIVKAVNNVMPVMPIY